MFSIFLFKHHTPLHNRFINKKMLAQPYDWLLRYCILHTLMLFIICMFLRPLWQLAMTRRALIIVFSRAIANVAHLLAAYPNFVVYILDANKLMPASYFYAMNATVRITESALHMHNLALAANRAHAICFPFHYNAFYAKKRKIYIICLLLWLLAVSVGIPDQFFRTWPVFRFSPSDMANKACMATAGICYVVLCCGMKKFKSTSVGSPASEKDPILIMLVCMACLFMSALCMVVLNPLATYSMLWPDVPKTIFRWSSFCAYLLALCTEEILLAILVPEFRVHIRRQFRSVFCCFCCRKSAVCPQIEVKKIENGRK